VFYSVAANPNCSRRTGTLTIGGQTFTVDQSGGSGNYSIFPTSALPLGSGGSGSVSVTAGLGCSWTAVSNDGWITVTSGSSGTGNGAVFYSVASNPTCLTRNGSMTIAGRTFTVSQSGGSGSFSITPGSRTHGPGVESSFVTVFASAGCFWTVNNPLSWVTITSSSSGTGNGTVNYSVSANPNCVSRSGNLTIAGQTFTVTQVAGSEPWTPKFGPVVKLVFSRSAPCEREQIDEAKTKTV
jgi:hypothetical protein